MAGKPNAPEAITEKVKLRKGWNQDKEASKVDARTRDRVKRQSEARNKIGQVVALQQQAQQKQAASLALSQRTGMDLVSAATAAQAIAQANNNKPGHKAGNNASAKGKWAKLLAGAKNVKQLARRIEKLQNGLFDVDELKGFQDGVDPVHEGPDHYDGTAMDINVTRKNNTKCETRKLKRLMKVINKLYGSEVDQQFGLWNDPEGHPTHYHQSFDSRRF